MSVILPLATRTPIVTVVTVVIVVVDEDHLRCQLARAYHWPIRWILMCVCVCECARIQRAILASDETRWLSCDCGCDRCRHWSRWCRFKVYPLVTFHTYIILELSFRVQLVSLGPKTSSTNYNESILGAQNRFCIWILWIFFGWRMTTLLDAINERVYSLLSLGNAQMAIFGQNQMHSAAVCVVHSSVYFINFDFDMFFLFVFVLFFFSKEKKTLWNDKFLLLTDHNVTPVVYWKLTSARTKKKRPKRNKKIVVRWRERDAIQNDHEKAILMSKSIFSQAALYLHFLLSSLFAFFVPFFSSSSSSSPPPSFAATVAMAFLLLLLLFQNKYVI